MKRLLQIIRHMLLIKDEESVKLEDDNTMRLLILTEKDQKTYIELQEQYDREISRANSTLRKIGWLIYNSEVEEEKLKLLDREVKIIRGLKDE